MPLQSVHLSGADDGRAAAGGASAFAWLRKSGSGESGLLASMHLSSRDHGRPAAGRY
jgi:hypothetical protein